MPKLVLSFIIILSFVLGFVNDVSPSTHSTDNSLVKITAVTNSVNQSFSSNSKSCTNKDCHDHKAHCVHHCSGIHNVIETKVSYKFVEKINKDKITWYYNFHYDEPFLDPALKPPLFS